MIEVPRTDIYLEKVFCEQFPEQITLTTLHSIPTPFLHALEKVHGIRLFNPKASDLKKYADTLIEVSEGLKKKNSRDAFISQNYLEKSDVRAAYQLYYTPINAIKTFYPLDELKPYLSEKLSEKETLNILDLGCGLGAMSLGFSFWNELNLKKNVILSAIDHSQKALSDFEQLFRLCGFTHELKPIHSAIGNSNLQIDKSFDLVFAGNVLNELSDEEEILFENLFLKNLEETGFAILIEPAQMEPSRRLMKLRDRLLSKGFFIFSPCFTRKPCPMLSQETDWCHHSLLWERPLYIEILDEMIGHIKKSLKFSYMIVSKTDRHVADHVFDKRDFHSQFRTTSDTTKEKGRFVLSVCNDNGWQECLLNKRDLSDSNEPIKELVRYDIVEIRDSILEKEKIKIKKDTHVIRPVYP